MGLSASQARLLSITKRLNNNELQSEFITNSKIQLANKNVKATDKYINSLDSTRMEYQSYDETGGKDKIALTFNALSAYGSLKKQYNIYNADGQVIVSEKDAENFAESKDLSEFLNKYDVLITNSDQDPVYQEEYKKYEKEHEAWEQDKNGYAPYMLEQWKQEQIQKYKEDHKKWEAEKIKHEEIDIPAFENDTAIFNDYQKATENGSLYSQFSNIVGTADSPNTSAGVCYDKALKGDTGCYRHIISHLVDYDTTRSDHISTTTYTTSSGATHNLLNDEGGLGEKSEFNSISSALNFTYSNGKPIFLCDGNDKYDGENDTVKENYLEIAYKNYNKIFADEIIAQNAVDEAQAAYDAIVGEIDEIQTTIEEITAGITSNRNELTTTNNAITETDKEISIIEAAVQTAIANGDTQKELEELEKLQTAKNEKQALESQKERITNEIAALTTDRENAIAQKVEAASRKTEAQSVLTEAQTNLNTEQSANTTKKTYAKQQLEKWTLLSDYQITADGTYELKSLKQKAIDIDYALTHNILTDADEKKTILINFTDGDMQMIEMKQPEKPVLRAEPVLDISNPPIFIFESPEPQPPKFEEGKILDSAKAQWYINLWYAMNGNDSPQMLNKVYNNDANVTYFTIKNIERCDLNGEGQNHYKALKGKEAALASNPDWIQHALTNGIITLKHAGLNTQNDIKWSGIEFCSTGDIKEVQDDTKIAQAEAEYNKAMREIQSDDKKYDQQLRKLDTEHSAMKQELDSIKNVMSKNIERSFAAFS